MQDQRKILARFAYFLQDGFYWESWLAKGYHINVEILGGYNQEFITFKQCVTHINYF